MAGLWRDFWISETGTGQQVAQLHDRYMMMMMMMMIIIIIIIIITTPKIHFIHLGIKKIYYCSFRAFYVICALFSTKCHLLKKFIFCSINTHCFKNINPVV